MLAIGRALMGKPKLLLLDEPSLGLSPTLVDQILEAIVALRSKSVTVLLVERTPALPLRLPIAVMFSKPAKSRSRARARRCCPIRK
jgi:ABC-type branched-subunit amino acid transport system ATPase component